MTELDCHNNLMPQLDISNCKLLQLDQVICGSQWRNSDKITPLTMTLTISSSNTGSLQYRDTYNFGVSIDPKE